MINKNLRELRYFDYSKGENRGEDGGAIDRSSLIIVASHERK